MCLIDDIYLSCYTMQFDKTSFLVCIFNPLTLLCFLTWPSLFITQWVFTLCLLFSLSHFIICCSLRHNQALINLYFILCFQFCLWLSAITLILNIPKWQGVKMWSLDKTCGELVPTLRKSLIETWKLSEACSGVGCELKPFILLFIACNVKGLTMCYAPTILKELI